MKSIIAVLKLFQTKPSKKLLIALLIILVSLIYGLPHIILSLKLGTKYTPLTVSGQSPIARDETYAYAPFINHILKGNFFIRDTYVYEYKDLPTPFLGETAPALLFAVLSRLTGSIERAFIVSDFIFPPVIFLMLYLLARNFIDNQFYALTTSFLTVIARDFIAVIPYPHATYQYLTVAENQNYFLYLSRAFHPQLTFIFFSLAVISMLKLVQNPFKKIYIIFLGISFGLLFYSYIFYWTYFFVFFGLIFLYFLIKRDFRTLRSLFFAGLLSLLIGLYYLFNMFKFYQLPFSQDFVSKSSLYNLPIPITLIRYLLIMVFFYVIYKQKDRKFYVLFFLLLGGILISPISKLLVGQDLETFHYLRRALMPFATITFFATIYFLIKTHKTLIQITALLVFIIAIFTGFRTQIIASQKVQKVHVRDDTQQSVFDWFRKNTPKNSVIGSIDTSFNSLIPVYTRNKVFFPPTDRTITPTYEEVERYAILAKILGIDTNWQKRNLDTIISYLFIYQAYNQNNNLDLNSPRRIWAESEIDRLANNNWRELASKYKLDYVIVSPNELSIVNPDIKLLKPVTSVGDYIIFKFQD